MSSFAEFGNVRFAGGTIIEHRPSGRVEGVIQEGRVAEDGDVEVTWMSDGCQRTLVFSPVHWHGTLGQGAVMIGRMTWEPPGTRFTPSPNVSLYTVMLPP